MGLPAGGFGRAESPRTSGSLAAYTDFLGQTRRRHRIKENSKSKPLAEVEISRRSEAELLPRCLRRPYQPEALGSGVYFSATPALGLVMV